MTIAKPEPSPEGTPVQLQDLVPIPFVDAPVGTLEHDGHDIQVWSIAATPAGKVLFCNCDGADAAVSATLKRLCRKSGGKATFHPAEGVTWPGPVNLTKLADSYEVITQALTHNGMRLKNQCVIPASLSIAAGLSRPLEQVMAGVPKSALADGGENENGEDTPEEAGTEPCADEDPDPVEAPVAEFFRYVLGDARSDYAPKGALFAHLKALTVVCHLSWEPVLWEMGLERGLLVPQPALGVKVWSITRDRQQWEDLVGECWLSGLLPRPEPAPLLATRKKRAQKAKSAS